MSCLLSLNHRVTCEVSSKALVEQVLLVVGKHAGCGKIILASQLNNSVVVLVKDRELLHRLIEH